MSDKALRELERAMRRSDRDQQRLDEFTARATASAAAVTSLVEATPALEDIVLADDPKAAIAVAKEVDREARNEDKKGRKPE